MAIRIGSNFSTLEGTKEKIHMLRNNIEMTDTAKEVVRRWAPRNGISSVGFHGFSGYIRWSTVPGVDELERNIFLQRDLEGRIHASTYVRMPTESHGDLGSMNWFARQRALRKTFKNWKRRSSRSYIFDESDLEKMLDRLKRFGDLVRKEHLLTTSQLLKRPEVVNDVKRR